jgi:hypothetical protein
MAKRTVVDYLKRCESRLPNGGTRKMDEMLRRSEGLPFCDFNAGDGSGDATTIQADTMASRFTL